MKKLRSILFLAALFAGGHALVAEASAVKNCLVSFETIGKPVLVQIKGKSGEPCSGTYTIDGNKLSKSEFKMSLTKLDTGIPLRNKHLRDNYLHIEKFPDAVLTITKIDNLATQKLGKESGYSPFSADLSAHGVTKPVTESKYRIKGNRAEAIFRMELMDFGIDRPMFMGIKVVDAVLITVEFDIDG